MYQDSNRTCRTIVLLIKPFVWGCSRRRRRRRLLKLPKVTKQQREIATFCIFEKRELYDGQFLKFLFRILTLSYSIDRLNESKFSRDSWVEC